MKRTLLALGCIALLVATFAAHSGAGQIWTDFDGDGLPDTCPGTFGVTPSTNVTIGIWIDSQSFVWTNFLVYLEWADGCFTYVSAEYVISGGSNFPFDSDVPLMWGGSEYNESGVDHIGNLTLHVDAPVGCCVTPVIDIHNPDYIFSALGNGSSYFLFSTNPGMCFGTPPPLSGACCFPDGSCQEMDPSSCSAAGGAYRGDCTRCVDAGCQPQAQACCFCPFGECQELTIDECIAAGGFPAGPDTQCETTSCDCPPPYGACCFPDGSCVDGLTESECSAFGGDWQGLYTACNGQCVSTSVEGSSWGQVKGLFR